MHALGEIDEMHVSVGLFFDGIVVFCVVIVLAC
jgi:hypothetical protein